MVSKYFGQLGGFAADVPGQLAIVQGFGWNPTNRLEQSITTLPDTIRELQSPNLVGAYAAFFNTRLFNTLISAVSPQVAGGQFDLSPRYVNQIPLPDLGASLLEENLGPLVKELDALGREIQTNSFAWRARADRIASRLYGVASEDWFDE